MLKFDCSYFPGDRPCKYNKEQGIKCDSCDYYLKIKFKILIIKLDAVGDVLRTTSILRPLKEKYPGSHITWCTRKEAKDLFINNELVNEVIFVNDDSEYRLSVEKFNIVINLDTSKISSAIAATAAGEQKIGFVLNESGSVIPTSEEANVWLKMSAFDDFKAANKLSYQQLMYNIIGLSSKISPPILKFKQTNSEKLRNEYELRKNYLTIGLNTGVGTKWPSKGWPLSNWEGLIELLKPEQFNLLLLGGPEEKEKNEFLSQKFNYLVNTGCDNSIMEFAHIIDLCDVVITADTFALHIATALQKHIVALFGPTSISEIELYKKGTKIFSDEKCECFYKRYCTQVVSCMEKISADTVYKAIKSIKL